MKFKMNTTQTSSNAFFSKYRTDYSFKEGLFSRPMKGSCDTTTLTTLGKIGAACGTAGAVLGLVATAYRFGKELKADAEAKKAQQQQQNEQQNEQS